MIDSFCGFDDDFFEVFKKFMASKTEIQKDGILLFDEMSTRESINVNTKNLSYTGLADFGGEIEENCDLANKANHALVMTFQPLADNYSQPVCVFASHGPVKGNELAKLIIKCIVLLENAGARIHGIVSDGASTNSKVWEIFGVSGKRKNSKCFFNIPQ